MDNFKEIGEVAKFVLADLKDKMEQNFEVKQPAQNDNHAQSEVI